MQFTREAQELMVDSVRSAPLGETEFRHIAELGNMYLARDDAPEGDEYVTLMLVSIDDAPHKICQKVLPGS